MDVARSSLLLKLLQTTIALEALVIRASSLPWLVSGKSTPDGLVSSTARETDCDLHSLASSSDAKKLIDVFTK